jgi:phosphoserine phosphatase
VRTMSAHGARCVLVSGGFDYFTRQVAQAAGFADHRANRLLDDGSRLTGDVAEPILGRAAKLEALREEAAALGVGLAETLAVGDGANDLAMIEAAGLGVAYRAKPVVAALADAAVDHADLTALLYFQGYGADAFV